jgi:hypothetical protein
MSTKLVTAALEVVGRVVAAIETTDWEPVLGTGAGSFRGTRGRSKELAEENPKPHRPTKDKAGSRTPPTRRRALQHGKEGVDR